MECGGGGGGEGRDNGEQVDGERQTGIETKTEKERKREGGGKQTNRQTESEWGRLAGRGDCVKRLTMLFSIDVRISIA